MEELAATHHFFFFLLAESPVAEMANGGLSRLEGFEYGNALAFKWEIKKKSKRRHVLLLLLFFFRKKKRSQFVGREKGKLFINYTWGGLKIKCGSKIAIVCSQISPYTVCKLVDMV